MDELLAQIEELEEAVKYRLAAARRRNHAHQREVSQIMKFGVCPCAVMGRFSTCCGVNDGR